MIKNISESISKLVLVLFVPLILTMLFVFILQFPDLLFSFLGFSDGHRLFNITMIRFWKIYGIFLFLWGACLSFLYSAED